MKGEKIFLYIQNLVVKITNNEQLSIANDNYSECNCGDTYDELNC
jgi:hypothetical protein